jgi:hypothetical protein
LPQVAQDLSCVRDVKIYSRPPNGTNPWTSNADKPLRFCRCFLLWAHQAKKHPREHLFYLQAQVASYLRQVGLSSAPSAKLSAIVAGLPNVALLQHLDAQVESLDALGAAAATRGTWD